MGRCAGGHGGRRINRPKWRTMQISNIFRNISIFGPREARGLKTYLQRNERKQSICMRQITEVPNPAKRREVNSGNHTDLYPLKNCYKTVKGSNLLIISIPLDNTAETRIKQRKVGKSKIKIEQQMHKCHEPLESFSCELVPVQY